MPQNIYITDSQFNWLLQDLNWDDDSSERQQELLDRATGEFEADMAERYEVPLRTPGGSYNTAPQFAKNKVLNTLKSKVRELIGYDKNRNLIGTVDSNQKFINVHSQEYSASKKALLNPKIDFGFVLVPSAENSQIAVQHIGLARADHEMDPFVLDGDIL